MSVHLVKGADPVLRDRVVDHLVRELVGADDRTLVVEDVLVPGRATSGGGEPAAETAGGAQAREAAVNAALNAAQSPPFMTACRVVVLRDSGNLTAADAARFVEYLDDPLDTTELVFVVGGGRFPDALSRKLKAVRAHEVGPGAEKTADVLGAALAEAGVELTSQARERVVYHLGEEAGRIGGLVEHLEGASALSGGPLDVEDVEPYLGAMGSVPMYELTDAVATGDVARALEVLERLLTSSGPRQPKPAHPLQVLGVLHGHYRRLLHLDDPAVRTQDQAVAALGGTVKPYPARKALDAARALGSEGIRDAFALLHQADLDLKGARAIPPEVVVEVLVARLASRAGRTPGRAPRRPTRRG
jgi:DNA polymerase-3 subunit delta